MRTVSPDLSGSCGQERSEDRGGEHPSRGAQHLRALRDDDVFAVRSLGFHTRSAARLAKRITPVEGWFRASRAVLIQCFGLAAFLSPAAIFLVAVGGVWKRKGSSTRLLRALGGLTVAVIALAVFDAAVEVLALRRHADPDRRRLRDSGSPICCDAWVQRAGAPR